MTSPETADSPEELGHLVKGLDFSDLVEYAKTMDIAGYPELDGMVGSRKITIHGVPATVGWVAHRDFEAVGHRQHETPQIEVTNPGGEDVVIAEGELSARIMPAGGGRRDDSAAARNGRPGFLQFDGGDTVWLSVPAEQPEPTWYVCFYPEVANTEPVA